jgi:hypothetical protein
MAKIQDNEDLHERIARLEADMEWVKMGTGANVGFSIIALLQLLLGAK